MQRPLQMSDGVVVGADDLQEWLLPWWWDHFSQQNRYPVTFVDFGMSEEKRRWCLERGGLLSLNMSDLFVRDRDEVASALSEAWEQHYGEDFWGARKAWFRKPFACLRTPYERTIWLDLDCQVMGSLTKLFDACSHPSGVALCLDKNAPVYNSGVIVFRRDAPILQEWADQALEKSGLFRGDQDLLTAIIDKRAIYELPAIYNWPFNYGANPDAVITHWIGAAGKEILNRQLMLKQFER